MNAEEKYLFDLMGFLVVKQALSRTEVEELNALIDSYDLWRKAESGKESAWKNDPNFMTIGSLHTWDEPFRRLLAHPRMVPYLKTLVGPKFRYDHGHALLMRAGAKQLGLHGGNTPWDAAQEYRYRDGEILNGLVVVSFALADAGPDDGGFAVIPGSHKANFAVPKPYISFERTGPWVLRVPVGLGTQSCSARRARTAPGRGAPSTSGATCSTNSRPGIRHGRRRIRRRRTRPKSIIRSRSRGSSTGRTRHQCRTRPTSSGEKTCCEPDEGRWKSAHG
jgi:hypothetical protein